MKNLTEEKVRNNPSIYTEDLIDPLIELFTENFPTRFSPGKLDYLRVSENIIHHSKIELEPNDRGVEDTNNIINFELLYKAGAEPVFDNIEYINQVDRIKKIKPLRQYEMLDFTITIPDLDIATFRDIQRHRYFSIIINKWDLMHDSEAELHLLASTLATPIDITIKGNLRQWTHAIEMRTQEQGHHNYRCIFQKCGELIADNLNVNKTILFP